MNDQAYKIFSRASEAHRRRNSLRGIDTIPARLERDRLLEELEGLGRELRVLRARRDAGEEGGS